jgi:single-stranded-DNA-specific exonuclease
MPLSAIEYNQQSGRAGRDGHPALIHVLFGEEDAGLNRRLLESYSPSRAALVELYKLLRDLASPEPGEDGTRAACDSVDDEATGDRSGLAATNDDLLEMLRDRKAKVSISARGVSSGLRILEELGLLRLEGSSRYRRIILESAPAQKLSLSESVRFQEGADEKDAFAEFSTWALESRDGELLSAINRPICPTDGVASDAAASSAPDASAVLAATFGDVVMQDPGGT